MLPIYVISSHVLLLNGQLHGQLKDVFAPGVYKCCSKFESWPYIDVA